MHSIIITCAGTGSRMGLGYNKMLYKHKGEYLFNITISKFLKYNEFKNIIITVNEIDYEIFKNNIVDDKRINIVIGDSERQTSVYKGLMHIDTKYVWVHDGARCNINDELILNLLNEVSDKYDGYALYVTPKDSLRIINGDIIENTLDRDQVAIMQTPQIANTNVLKMAYKKVFDNNLLLTDETGILLYDNKVVKKILGSYSNIKMTTKEDMRMLDE